MWPRYEVRPPAFEIDFEVIVDVVFGATWIILPPASWCWPLPANAMERTSPFAPRSIRQTEGHFIVICEPRFPSTHSTVASAYAIARFVTRLNTLVHQSVIVAYWKR